LVKATAAQRIHGRNEGESTSRALAIKGFFFQIGPVFPAIDIESLLALWQPESTSYINSKNRPIHQTPALIILDGAVHKNMQPNMLEAGTRHTKTSLAFA